MTDAGLRAWLYKYTFPTFDKPPFNKPDWGVKRPLLFPPPKPRVLKNPKKSDNMDTDEEPPRRRKSRGVAKAPRRSRSRSRDDDETDDDDETVIRRQTKAKAKAKARKASPPPKKKKIPKLAQRHPPASSSSSSSSKSPSTGTKSPSAGTKSTGTKSGVPNRRYVAESDEDSDEFHPEKPRGKGVSPKSKTPPPSAADLDAALTAVTMAAQVPQHGYQVPQHGYQVPELSLRRPLEYPGPGTDTEATMLNHVLQQNSMLVENYKGIQQELATLKTLLSQRSATGGGILSMPIPTAASGTASTNGASSVTVAAQLTYPPDYSVTFKQPNYDYSWIDNFAPQPNAPKSPETGAKPFSVLYGTPPRTEYQAPAYRLADSPKVKAVTPKEVLTQPLDHDALDILYTQAAHQTPQTQTQTDVVPSGIYSSLEASGVATAPPPSLPLTGLPATQEVVPESQPEDNYWSSSSKAPIESRMKRPCPPTPPCPVPKIADDDHDGGMSETSESAPKRRRRNAEQMLLESAGASSNTRPSANRRKGHGV